MWIGRRWVLVSAMVAVAIALGTTAFRQTDRQHTVGRSASSTTITVSAAASLQDVLKDIVQQYEARQNGGATVNIILNFASSGALRQQIEQGAPVDIFLSASLLHMDALENKELLRPGSRQNLLGNQMVLIQPNDREDDERNEGSEEREGAIATFPDLAQPQVKRIVIGEPSSVPAGTYAKAVLNSFQIYESLTPKFVFAKDVRQALAYVASGNVEAGIVYATDAALSSQVDIVATAPSARHPPIVYPIAQLADSRSPEAAQAFMDFLTSAMAAANFERYGFIVKPDVAD